MILLVGASFLAATPARALAQGRDKHESTPAVSVTLTPDMRVLIENFYSTRNASSAETLPPGIRQRLARGKPLPPGIAKRAVPADLRSRIQLPAGYEIVEVGVDVLLVEVATDIIRDVLRDAVR